LGSAPLLFHALATPVYAVLRYAHLAPAYLLLFLVHCCCRHLRLGALPPGSACRTTASLPTPCRTFNMRTCHASPFTVWMPTRLPVPTCLPTHLPRFCTCLLPPRMLPLCHRRSYCIPSPAGSTAVLAAMPGSTACTTSMVSTAVLRCRTLHHCTVCCHHTCLGYAPLAPVTALLPLQRTAPFTACLLLPRVLGLPPLRLPPFWFRGFCVLPTF